MNFPRSLSSLRAGVLLLVAIVALPLIFLVVRSSEARRGDAHTAAVASAEDLAASIGADGTSAMLDDFHELLLDLELPRGSVVIITDLDDRIVARYPRADGLVGERLPERALRNLPPGSTRSDVMKGEDGTERLYVSTRVASRASGPNLRLVIGLPADHVFGEADAAFRTSVLEGLLVLSLGVLLAWVGAKRFLIDPVERLVEASHRIESGDLAARSGYQGAWEISRLSTAFDEMARELERRNDEMLRLDREREDIRQQTTAILDRSPAVVFVKDLEGRYLLVNRQFEESLGLRREDVIGKTDHEILPPEVVETLRRNDETVMRDGLAIQVEEAVPSPQGERRYVVAKFPLLGGGDQTVAIAGIATDITERIETTERLSEALEDLRRADVERRDLLRKLVIAQESERQRIGAGLHDDAIQVMSSVAMGLERLASGVEDVGLIARLELDVRDSIKRLRSLVFDLVPPIVDRGGVLHALEELLADVAEETGARTSLSGTVRAGLDRDLQVALYRIAREALTNVTKHAGATHVMVEVTEESEGIRLVISDDGVGFDPATPSPRAGHIGLVSMRERAEAAGGWVEIGSESGLGSRVELFLPSHGGRELNQEEALK